MDLSFLANLRMLLPASRGADVLRARTGGDTSGVRASAPVRARTDRETHPHDMVVVVVLVADWGSASRYSQEVCQEDAAC